jgi:predicted GIY-YIG superfamily endonuclease
MIYELGYIYAIWDCEYHNLVYYGSTNDFKNRMSKHKARNNDCNSKQIIDRGNYEYAILETHENIDEYDLIERERWFILNKVCVNKCIPHRTRAEWYQMNPNYNKDYYETNKEKIAEHHREHYQNNKEKIAERRRVYYQNNKEKIKKKFVCECGGKFTYGKKSRHEKSKMHLNYSLIV